VRKNVWRKAPERGGNMCRWSSNFEVYARKNKSEPSNGKQTCDHPRHVIIVDQSKLPVRKPRDPNVKLGAVPSPNTRVHPINLGTNEWPMHRAGEPDERRIDPVKIKPPKLPMGNTGRQMGNLIDGYKCCAA
jgi:hypothetical protein